MKDGQDETAGSDKGLHGHCPALQVICLGAGGGPCETDVTGLLVRSVASDWAKGSLLAVDAGSHLAPIVQILERDFPRVSGLKNGSGNGNANGAALPARASMSPSQESDQPARPEPTVLSTGPFAGLKLPNESARANALHIIRNYVNTYLITHPHLDHLSGFAVNTAAFHATSRPKTLAALPSTVDAVKQHIFNDVIWPNLSDEDGGVGVVTFQRLKEGGDAMVGEGEGRGYIDVSDGLGVKSFKVSHGVCTKSPPSHHHRGSIAGLSDTQLPYNGSIQGEAAVQMTRAVSMSQNSFSAPGTPGGHPRQSFHASYPSPRMAPADNQNCVVDSTAFFIRDTECNREVLIFGDVEPDSISLSPRTMGVWTEAAHKIAHGLLGGIFIECSYDDSQADAFLFGHMNPRHLIAELQTLASLVNSARQMVLQEKNARKRKRSAANGVGATSRHDTAENDRKRSRSLATRGGLSYDKRRSSVPDHMADLPSQLAATTSVDALDQIQNAHIEASHPAQLEPVSPKDIRPPPLLTSATQGSRRASEEMPLAGMKVVIIHIKDTMKDGPHVRDTILAQLQDYEHRLQQEGQGLGCEFVISRSGESYWF